jgi:hypothetical protein
MAVIAAIQTCDDHHDPGIQYRHAGEFSASHELLSETSPTAAIDSFVLSQHQNSILFSFVT